MFLALLTVALFAPMADTLERRGVPRAGAALLSLMVGTMLIVGLVGLVAFQLADQTPMLVDEYAQVHERVTTWLTRPPLDMSQAQVDTVVQRAMTGLQGSWSSMASRTFIVLEVFGAVVTALVMAFFLIRDASPAPGPSSPVHWRRSSRWSAAASPRGSWSWPSSSPSSSSTATSFNRS